MRKKLIMLALLLIFIGLVPFFSMIFSDIMGSLLGCQIDESNAKTCYFFGKNIGRLLYNMYVFGWAMAFSLPLSFLGVILLILVYTGSFFRQAYYKFKNKNNKGSEF